MKPLIIARSPYTSLILNFAYALGNCAVGFFTYSWWFITVGAYYAVLAVTRFSVLQTERKAKGNLNKEHFARRLSGILLVLLSCCLIGVNTLSAIQERGTVFHEVIMITIATYTFAKLTVSIAGVIRARQVSSPIVKTLRNISVADAFVSIYTLQRSMLLSFPGMEPAEIRLWNILTGTAVWLLVLLLGINLIGGNHVDMAKSKFSKANEKITEAVTGGYQKIETSVVGAYKKIEHGVVSSYTKIEDKFVEAYLTKDGETIKEAKARLKKDHQN